MYYSLSLILGCYKFLGFGGGRGGGGGRGRGGGDGGRGRCQSFRLSLIK